MEVVANNYMPGDPRLVEQLVYELKSQGIFDQFRKECIADVDTKPAYQNLRQRVESSVTLFLNEQTWRPDMNKNQLREQLRKNIYESGYLDTGVERIVDQVVNPKINTIFLPQVEDVVYRYLGIEKPNRVDVKKELKIDVTDLLPTDLEAISPESDHTKDDSLNFNDSLNSESKMEEDESPPFEPIDIQNSSVQHEENSVDSHLSGFSGLQSHDSNPCMEPKICQMELSNQDSQVSQNSSESRLSIVTSEDYTKMEIREDSDSKLLKSSDSNSQMETFPVKMPDSNSIGKDEIMKTVDETDSNSDNHVFDERNSKKHGDEKGADKVNDTATKKKQVDEKQSEYKRSNDRKIDEKKSSKSSERHGSKDKKDDRYKKRSSSTSEKEKSNLKRSSSSSSKDKEKNKDRKERRNSSNGNKDKDKTERDNSKNEKDRDKIKNDKDRKDRDRNERDKVEKSKSNKEKDKSVKDKAKSSSSSSSTSISKHTSKEKDKSSTSIKLDSSKKDKEKSRSSSSKDKSKSSYSDSKSKSSSDKHKRDDKSTHSVKHSSSSSSSKRDKDKKKTAKDDHYSSKDKKNDRRSTDRDSNDGRSGRQGQTNSFSESSSSQTQKSNEESSNLNSGSGSGDSGTSDQIEEMIMSNKMVEDFDKERPLSCLDMQKFKYIKPKFASNFQEARKLMKIRKQLAKLERHNQLSLAQIEVPPEVPVLNGISCEESDTFNSAVEDKHIEKVDEVQDFVDKSKSEIYKCEMSLEDNSLLQSKELSRENWEALEARLAQEMSNINYNSYESPYDDYDYGGCNSVITSPKKISPSKYVVQKKEENVQNSESDELQVKQIETFAEKFAVSQTDMGTESAEEVKIVTEEIKEDYISDNVMSVNVSDVSEANENNKDDAVKEVGEKDEPKNEIINADEPEYINKVQDTKTVEFDIDSNKTGIATEDKVDSIENMQCDLETSEPCFYLEPHSPRLEKNLQFLYKYIEKLEQDVKHSLKTFQNNFVPLKERYRKRKLVGNVDVRNNNKAHYEQTTDVKKRRRGVTPNPNSVISKANKAKICNSSDVSPNDSFSLPLSPAESDKSNDKREEESPKAKQKRESVGKSANTRSQRYSSEDLYKPRPLFISSRRSRAKNLEK